MTPETTGFHFAQAAWLWGLLVPLLVWLLPPGRVADLDARERLKRYSDPHLLQHLLQPARDDIQARHHTLWMWSLLWSLGIIAMAGPRWDYTNVSVFQPGSDVVILLDLSRSMEVTDVRPSRLARARQETEDLINFNKTARIGMVAFATVAHIVAPITEDTQALRHLLPSLGTELSHPQLQGSRLGMALERAQYLLSSQPRGNARSILLVTDGDFDEPELERIVRRMNSSGIKLHILGVGSSQGGNVPAAQGGLVQDREGKPVVSRLNEETLQKLAAAGGGVYVRADYRNDDTQMILQKLQDDAPPMLERNPILLWHERYYLPLLALMGFLLMRFRRGRSSLR